MAELGAIGSIVGIAAAGAKLSMVLFDFASTVGSARYEVQQIGTEISQFCAFLKQLHSTLTKAKARRDVLLASSRGVILDVGPGAGHQLFRFSHPENITMIYGAEPGVSMHAVLRESAHKTGLGDKYRILACGAESDSLIPALAKEGLLGEERMLGNGVFDEIVCIRVLCSVPRVQETIEVLYKCLKPGGRFVLCEHVINAGSEGSSLVGWFLQYLYTALGWSLLLGGCQLRRDTTALLMKATEADGRWAKVQLEKVDEWSAVPHIVGYCIKKA